MSTIGTVNSSIPASKITTNNPDNYDYIFCKGFAYGEIKDYKLNPIAKIIYLIKDKPSFLRVIRAKIIIQQDPNYVSLKILDPVNNYSINYYGNITITFFASFVKVNMDAVGHCENCTYIICQGLFGYINIEQN